MAEKRIPRVRLGDTWVPAHKIWDMVESINTATDLIEKFNETRPHLTTPITEEVVNTVRTRIRDMELSSGSAKSLEEAAALAAALEAELVAGEQHHGSNTVIPMDKGRGALTPEEEVRADSARQLLAAMPLEDALSMIQQEYGDHLHVYDLIKMVGAEAYQDALAREAKDYEANKITPDQIAVLWNESGIARPTGGLWTEADIRELLS